MHMFYIKGMDDANRDFWDFYDLWTTREDHGPEGHAEVVRQYLNGFDSALKDRARSILKIA